MAAIDQSKRLKRVLLTCLTTMSNGQGDITLIQHRQKKRDERWLAVVDLLFDTIQKLSSVKSTRVSD